MSLTHSADAQEVQQTRRVDFQAAIWPILRDRCVACHGAEQQQGDLRLDTVAGLKKGGASGKSLLKGELVRRVSTDGPGSMPLDGPRLSDAEIATIRQWIAEGARWPANAGAERLVPESPLKKPAEWLHSVTRHTRWFFIAAICFGVVILWIERKKKRVGADSNASEHGAVGGAHYLVVLLGLAVGGLWRHHQLATEENLRTIDSLEKQLVDLANPQATLGGDEFGPVPRRPGHPPRLGGEYYRGNDERDERLFNGGFYRTAAFRVFLVDGTGKRLETGSPVPTDGVFLDFELDRSQGTSAGHFTDHSISSIFLSRQAGNAVAIDDPVPVEVVEPDWKWRARYKLPAATQSGRLAGRVYVYCSASVEDGTIRGSRHYGITYAIQIAGGVITDDSEIWMGSLFQTENVVQTPPGRIPVTEWFDFRPIPEIVGENSKDPQLLGLENPDG